MTANCNVFCGKCREWRNASPRLVEDTFEVRGEAISLMVDVYHCDVCGEPQADPPDAPDSADLALAEYRRRKKLLRPDEIRSFRMQAGLTQQELAALLGWGSITLSRYENGALQDIAHDRALRLAMRSGALQELLGLATDISAQRRIEIESKLRGERRPRIVALNMSPAGIVALSYDDDDGQSGEPKLKKAKLPRAWRSVEEEAWKERQRWPQ